MTAKVIVPASINWPEHTTSYPLPPKVKVEHLKFILSLIHSIPMRNENTIDVNGYVNVNIKTLRKYVRLAKEHVDYLEDSGILEKRKYGSDYSKGRSRSYRISKEFEIPGHEVEIIDSRFAKKIKQFSKILGGSSYRHISKYISQVSIRANEAKEFIKYQYEIDLKSIPRRKANLKYTHRLNSIVNIDEGNYWFKVDRTSGRMHSNFTIMNSILRPFLDYRGLNLYSCDVCNSQPYVSTILFNPDFTCGGNPELITIDDCYNTNSKIKYTITNEINKHSIMLSQSLESNENQDVTAYLKHTSEGSFYEYCSKEMEKEELTRKEVKGIVITVLYEHHDTTNTRSITQIDKFSSTFPSVYTVIKGIKEQGHSVFPVLMQKIEAKIMKRIALRIKQEYPKMFFLTIHDSIVTTRNFIQIAERLMLEEFEKGVGKRPTLKIEDWR